MALQPAQNYLKKFYQIPTKGLNNRFDPTLLQDAEAANLENLQVNQDGTLAKYPGYSKNGSPFPNNSDSFIRMLHNFKRGSSIDTLLIAAQDDGNTNSTYKVDIKSTIGDGTYTYIGHTLHTATFAASTTITGSSTTWLTELKAGDKIKNSVDADSKYVEIANVNSDTSLTLTGSYAGTTGSSQTYIARKIWNLNNIPRAVTFDNFAVITNGVDVPQLWDNTSLNSITDPDAPKAKYLEVHKNRLFMANTSTDPSGLYWSAANDPTTWDPVSYESVSAQDGGSIVSIKSFSNSLIVFKSNGKVYQVIGNFDQNAQGSPDFIRQLDIWENIGIIADRSPVVHNNMLYFMCETGVYAIDPRMFVQKVSYMIDPFISTINFSLGGNVNKTFPEVTKTQWDSGTHDGTWASNLGVFSTFFDSYTQTDALQQRNCCSVAIGTDNTLHVAYVPNATTTQINYLRYRPGGSNLGGNAIEKETSILSTTTNDIKCLSIAVKSSDQTVGIAYADSSGNMHFVERTPDTPSPFAYGTWGSPVGIASTLAVVNINMKYLGGLATLACNQYNGGNGHYQLGFAINNSGWTFTNISTQGTNGVPDQMRCVIDIDGSTFLYVSSFAKDNSILFAYKSTNGGVTWSQIEQFVPGTASDYRSELSLGFNNAGDYLSVFSDTNGAIIKRNHTHLSSTTINTTAGSYFGGWFPVYNTIDAANNDTDNYSQIISAASNDQETITTNYKAATSGTTITNPSTNTVLNSGSNSSGSYRPGTASFNHNSRTIAQIFYGPTTNSVVIRRVAPFAVYLSQDNSDATLTSWGSFLVTGEVDNGNTTTHAIALGSVANPTTFNTIMSGSTISSNASLIYAINRVIVQGGAWAGVSITSIVLNYVGAGADAKQVVGQEFFNEIYFAVCETGNTTNDKVLIYDIANAPLKVTYKVSAMARYKTNLWGGSATNGDLYILKQNYDFNGASYSSDFQSREDFFDTMELDKEIYRAFVTFKTQTSGSFTFSYRFNNFLTPGGAAWNSVTVDQTQSSIAEIPQLSGKLFRSFQYRIQDSNTGVPISVIGLTIRYGMVSMR